MTTLADLRFQARSRADMLYSDFVTDTELNFYINNSVAELYDILVASFADYYVKDPVVFTLTGTTDTYNLPTDFYKLRRLDRNINAISQPSSWFTVYNFNFFEGNKYNTQTLVGSNWPLTYYRVMASSTSSKIIRLVPEQNVAGTYRLWYIPTCPTLVSDSDSFDGINKWDEYVVVDAAIKMLQKQEDETATLVMQKKALVDRIEAMAADRDSSGPEHITDVRSSAGNPLGAGWGNGGYWGW